MSLVQGSFAKETYYSIHKHIHIYTQTRYASFVCGTWIVCMCNNSFLGLTRLISRFDTTDSLMWYDSNLCVMWRIPSCDRLERSGLLPPYAVLDIRFISLYLLLQGYLNMDFYYARCIFIFISSSRGCKPMPGPSQQWTQNCWLTRTSLKICLPSSSHNGCHHVYIRIHSCVYMYILRERLRE